MREERITSRQNPLLRHAKKLLTSRSYRESCGEFAADGTKLLEEAARWVPGLHTVIANDSCSLFGSSCRRFAWQGFSRRCSGLDFCFWCCFSFLLFYESRSRLFLETRRLCRSDIPARWHRNCFIRQ